MIATPGSTGATSATTPNTITAIPSRSSSARHAVATFTSNAFACGFHEAQQAPRLPP